MPSLRNLPDDKNHRIKLPSHRQPDMQRQDLSGRIPEFPFLLPGNSSLELLRQQPSVQIHMAVPDRRMVQMSS